MKEAVITIIVPEQDDEPAHTEVWRVEFEGDLIVDVIADNVVAYEMLSAI